MSVNIVIVPYSWFSTIWTTKWYNYIKHLIEDYNWICIDISDKNKYKAKISLKELLKPYDKIDNVLYWNQNIYYHFSELFNYDLDRNIKISFYYDDIHFYTSVKKNECNKYAYKVFSSMPFKIFNHYLPSILNKYIFIPHGATNEFIIPLNENPENKISLSGEIIIKYYPHRIQMLNLSKKEEYKNKIFYLKHPGYRSHDIKTVVTGKKYAEFLHKYVSSFTSGVVLSRIHTIISKVFEIPATGSLLMLNEELQEEVKNLGFKPNENYIEYNMQNMEEKIAFILNPVNKDIIRKIRIYGQELIFKQHMAKHRAESIHNYLNN